MKWTRHAECDPASDAVTAAFREPYIGFNLCLDAVDSGAKRSKNTELPALLQASGGVPYERAQLCPILKSSRQRATMLRRRVLQSLAALSKQAAAPRLGSLQATFPAAVPELEIAASASRSGKVVCQLVWRGPQWPCPHGHGWLALCLSSASPASPAAPLGQALRHLCGSWPDDRRRLAQRWLHQRRRSG